jgi:hypothetical protein
LRSMRARLRHRHWIPVMRVHAAASAWDRLAVDTPDVAIDLRRQGYSVSATLEFRFSELVVDDRELSLEREHLQAERRRDELLQRLHERYFAAKALLQQPGTDHVAAEEAIHLVEATAFGLHP